MVDSGYLEMLAEKVGDDTTFAKIIELVEEAQESKTKISCSSPSRNVPMSLVSARR